MTASVTDLATRRPARRPLQVLRIDASARTHGSTTRALTDAAIARLQATDPDLEVAVRDLTAGVPLIDEAWVEANFTPAEQRSPAQRDALAASDVLVAELQAADVLVIGLPVYNFGPPAALKAWIDQVARARVTFRYTPDGPVGLLAGKRAYVVAASGGTALGSDIDFATPYLRHVLGFLGITDVSLIGADRQMVDAEAARSGAAAALDQVLPLSA